jgi:hypothetical protein
VAEIFTNMNLFPAKNLVFIKKNQPQSQGQIPKNLNKLYALERFFSGEGGQPLNYLMHGPEFNGKGLRDNFFWLKNIS